MVCDLFGDLVHLLELVVRVHDHVGVHDEVVGGEVPGVAENVLEEGGGDDLGDDLHDEGEGEEAEDDVETGADEVIAEEGAGLDEAALVVGVPAGLVGVEGMT